MVQFSRLVALSLVNVLLLVQIHPTACKSKAGSSPPANQGKGKNQNKKRKKKSSAPASRLYASEEPARSADTSPPASQKSPTPTLAPSKLLSDEKTNSSSSNDLQSSGSPSANPVGTSASSSNRSSNRSNVTVTPSPSFDDSFLEEEVPTIAPIESNNSTPTASPTTFPLPTVDQSQQIMADPTVVATTATGWSEKSVIMIVSLVGLFGGMGAILAWQLNNRRLRYWENVSDAPLV